ncbi:MAG: dihydrolipoyl dehydrogenase [Proteobacteria bacterium]|nr:dihydrolipoyl dehydrogenase [Pseudomonadota bacterium]
MFDVIVIGSGTGGYVSAIRAAQNGLKTAIVEAGDIGGTCLNRGCIPTKAIIGSVEVVHKFNIAGSFGVHINEMSFNWDEIQNRKEQIVNKLTSGVEFLLKKNGVEIIRGFASVDFNKKVSVKHKDGKEESFETKNIIVATGSEPLEPAIFNVDHKRVLNSTDALNMGKLPNSIVIVGSGAIGLEFATVFAKLGVEVDIIEMLPDIAPEIHDRKIVRTLALSLKKCGIKIHTGEKVESVEVGQNEVVIKTDKGNSFKAEKALIAIGRAINNDLLKKLGADFDGHFVKVKENMETSIEGVYAVGDITGGPLLAHKAEFEGVVAADSIAGKVNKRELFRNIPACIFTIPPVATCGYTEDDAKKEGIDVKTGDFNYSANGKALAMGESTGFCKVVTEKNSGKIIGVQIIGEGADIMISEASVLIKEGISAEEFSHIIHPHPTLGEILMESVHDSLDESIHKFKIKR